MQDLDRLPDGWLTTRAINELLEGCIKPSCISWHLRKIPGRRWLRVGKSRTLVYPPDSPGLAELLARADTSSPPPPGAVTLSELRATFGVFSAQIPALEKAGKVRRLSRHKRPDGPSVWYFDASGLAGEPG